LNRDIGLQLIAYVYTVCRWKYCINVVQRETKHNDRAVMIQQTRLTLNGDAALRTTSLKDLKTLHNYTIQ